MAGSVPPALLRDVQQFIELNQDALLPSQLFGGDNAVPRRAVPIEGLFETVFR